MPRYLVERNIAGAGDLTADDLRSISQKSCQVLQQMGPAIQWVESYVTPDKIYCVYVAPDAASIRRHAAEGGFPADHINQIRTMIDPTTAES